MSLLTTVRDTVGRLSPSRAWGAVKRVWHGLYASGSGEKADYSRTDYVFARDIYYNRRSGYQYGSAFAKPLICIAAAFSIGKPPDVEMDDEASQQAATRMLSRHAALLYYLARNGFRDGDTYVLLDESGEMQILPPRAVDVVVDTFNQSKVTGYDVRGSFEDEQGRVIYTRVEYRLDKVSRYEGKPDAPATAEVNTLVEETPNPLADVGLLPIVAFHNEKEPDEIYGHSDLEGLYFYFRQYHQVMDAGVRGAIYFATPTPVVQGIRDFDAFIRTNFEQNETTGEYELNWDPDQMLLLGEGTTAQMLTGGDFSGPVSTMLSLIFYLICQHSETAEFILGIHVKSSMASVQEQMPLVLKKAERKRSLLEESLVQLVRVWLAMRRRVEPGLTIPDRDDVSIVWPSILDKDLGTMLAIVEVLQREGVITDETALRLLDVVRDPAAEAEAAANERADRSQESDLFGTRLLFGNDQEGRSIAAPVLAGNGKQG